MMIDVTIETNGTPEDRRQYLKAYKWLASVYDYPPGMVLQAQFADRTVRAHVRGNHIIYRSHWG
jgi:hypothetical protein